MKRSIRTGVIGVGKMGNHHARVYAELETTSLIGVYDADRVLAAEVAARHGCRAFPTLDSLFNAGLDAVSIAVPTTLHAEMALRALKAGMHVLIEKPIAATPVEGERMVRAARKAKRILMVGHIERFNPAVAAIRAAVDPEKILSINITRVGPRPPRIKDAGVIIDLAVHDIDLVHYLTGQAIEAVYCVTASNFTRHEDTASLLLKTENGIAAQITTNWITPYKAREIQVVTAEALLKGNLITGQVQRFSRFSAEDGSYVVTELHTPRQEPLKAELAAFIHAIETGTEPPVTGDAGLRALSVAMEAAAFQAFADIGKEQPDAPAENRPAMPAAAHRPAPPRRLVPQD